MNQEEWKKTIVSQITVDTDLIPSFDTAITILSEVLAERDHVYSLYVDEGSKPVITFTTDRKSKNPKPNPLLRQWQDLNVTALQYMRDLGLSPAGLRKLQGQLPKSNSGPSFLESFDKQYSVTEDPEDE